MELKIVNDVQYVIYVCEVKTFVTLHILPDLRELPFILCIYVHYYFYTAKYCTYIFNKVCITHFLSNVQCWIELIILLLGKKEEQ